MVANVNVKERRDELEELALPELKNYFKDKELENPVGYWKMTKEQMIEEILKFEGQDKEDQVDEVVKEQPNKQKAEKITPSKEPKQKRTHKAEYIFKAINPEGKEMFQSNKLADVIKFANDNKIASAGWVNLSIRRKIPVLIGLGADKEVTDDFVPRTTSKYSGNYWRFTKEKIEEENSTEA